MHCTSATNLESFFIRLILFLKNNISFRCFIYVCIYSFFDLYLLFFIPASYRLTFIALYIFLGFYVLSGGRQILSIFLFYVAFELLKRNFFTCLFSIFLIVICSGLHKGTIFLLLPLFLMCIPINKKSVFISLCCVIFISLFLRYCLYDLITLYYPDYIYMYYFQEQAEEINISRRIYYSSQIVLFFKTCYVPYLLYLSFQSPSLYISKYRNFLYWGYFCYLCLYFANYSFSIPQRFINHMLLIPILVLISYLFHKKEYRLFRKMTWILLLLEILAANISISGIRQLY